MFQLKTVEQKQPEEKNPLEDITLTFKCLSLGTELSATFNLVSPSRLAKFGESLPFLNTKVSSSVDIVFFRETTCTLAKNFYCYVFEMATERVVSTFFRSLLIFCTAVSV